MCALCFCLLRPGWRKPKPDLLQVFGDKNLGYLTAETKSDLTTGEFDFKNNGRGPTISELIRSGAESIPLEWSITGTATFGSKVDERFRQAAGVEWTDSTGP